MSENKKFSYEVVDGKFIISVDPNEDGEALVKVEIMIAEIPDEVLDALKK